MVASSIPKDLFIHGKKDASLEIFMPVRVWKRLPRVSYFEVIDRLSRLRQRITLYYFESHHYEVDSEKRNLTKMSGHSISHQLAIKLAWEDPNTIRFIQSSFSHPEQKPEILTQTWISEKGKWNVSIIEKSLVFKTPKDSLINVALVEINSESGKIQRRRYFRNIFLSEYENIIQGRSSP